MMHGHNNNKNRNNNRRFSKNNNFKKRRFGGGGGGSHFEEEQFISPQQRRNFENKRDQHLMKAKEYLSAGERVEAENHFQHADHYHRMAIIGLDKIQQQQQQQQQNYNQQENAEGADNFAEAPAEEASNTYSDVPEIPVDMMGRFPSEDNQGQQRSDNRNNRNQHQGRRHNNRDNRDRGPRQQQNNAEASSAAPAEDNNLAALPFMQVPIKES